MMDNKPQVWEVRGDFPWLAFQDTPQGRRLQGVFIDSGESRVFKAEQGELMPHFKDVSDSLGFRDFALGYTVLRGTATVATTVTQALRIAPGFWGDAPLKWAVYDLKNRVTMGEGEGRAIRFQGRPDVSYMIQVERKTAA